MADAPATLGVAKAIPVRASPVLMSRTWSSKGKTGSRE